MTSIQPKEGHFIQSSFKIGPNTLLETGTIFLLTSTLHFHQTL